jgi:hypothetical protein
VLVVENIFLADLEFRRFPWDLTQKRDSTRRRSLGLNPAAVDILRIDAGFCIRS